MMGDGGWVWMMIFGPLMMILFIAAVVVLVAFALRWLTGHATPSPHGVAGHAHAPRGPPPPSSRPRRTRIDRGSAEGQHPGGRPSSSGQGRPTGRTEDDRTYASAVHTPAGADPLGIGRSRLDAARRRPRQDADRSA